MSTTKDILGTQTLGVRVNVGDITGTQGRRSVSVTRDSLAREAMSVLMLAGHGGDGTLDGLDADGVLAGIARSERRRGSRPLVGVRDIAPPVTIAGHRAVTACDAPVYESLADSLAESSACEADGLRFSAATSAALEHGRSVEGRIMALAGGMDWQGGTERVKTGADRALVTRTPSGGVVASVCRYTLSRAGGTIEPSVRQDMAAAAAAATWHAGCVGWQGRWCMAGLPADDSVDTQTLWAWLWRVAWRAARRVVTDESRAGRTGHGADRLPPMAVWDAQRPVGAPVRAGAVERRGASLDDAASYEAWQSDDVPALGAAWDDRLRTAVEWVSVTLAADHRHARAVTALVVAAHDAAGHEAAWDMAAAAGSYPSADALRAALARAGTWRRLHEAALAVPSLAEREAASLVAAWARAARHYGRRIERGGLLTVRHERAAAVRDAYWTARERRAAAVTRLAGVRRSSPGGGRGVRGAVVGRRVYGAVVDTTASSGEWYHAASDVATRTPILRRAEPGGTVLREWHTSGSVCRMATRAAGGRAVRAAAWADVTTGLWAGRVVEATAARAAARARWSARRSAARTAKRAAVTA